MQEFIELVRDLTNQPNSVTASFHRIDNFHKLVVDQLPYGQIDQNSLVQGHIEFDGPAQETRNHKKPLQWHFGGIAYEVSKAIRIRYSYQKYVDGVELAASGSLFIGYELGVPYYEALASAIGETASDKETAPPTTVAELISSLREGYSCSPATVMPLAKYVDVTNFDTFLLANFPFQDESVPTVTGGAAGWGDKPTPLSELFIDADSKLPGVRVEFDGPARDYDSHRPFPYTTDTLFNDPSGMYDKLLWWYFGGKAFRITKALRLGYTDPKGRKGSLLVGYQGPGPS
jgi:hypothetical protein